jgi:hypothetical protein
MADIDRAISGVTAFAPSHWIRALVLREHHSALESATKAALLSPKDAGYWGWSAISTSSNATISRQYRSTPSFIRLWILPLQQRPCCVGGRLTGFWAIGKELARIGSESTRSIVAASLRRRRP